MGDSDNSTPAPVDDLLSQTMDRTLSGISGELDKLRLQQKEGANFAPSRLKHFESAATTLCKMSAERRQMAKATYAELLEFTLEQKVDLMIEFFRKMPVEHKHAIARRFEEILAEPVEPVPTNGGH